MRSETWNLSTPIDSSCFLPFLPSCFSIQITSFFPSPITYSQSETTALFSFLTSTTYLSLLFKTQCFSTQVTYIGLSVMPTHIHLTLKLPSLSPFLIIALMANFLHSRVPIYSIFIYYLYKVTSVTLHGLLPPIHKEFLKFKMFFWPQILHHSGNKQTIPSKRQKQTNKKPKSKTK